MMRCTRNQTVTAFIRRVRRGRRLRGAAMVEGVVAIPFLLLMLAGTVFVGGFYAQRIDAQVQARQEVWLRAVNENCDSGANSSLPGLTIVDSADLGELSSSPLAALCNKDFGSVNYTARRQYTVTGRGINFDQEIMATAECPCNESPLSGDVAYEAAVEFLWNAYQNRGEIPPNAYRPTAFPIGNIFLFGGNIYL